MGHTYSSLHYHFIWSTKDRESIIKPIFQKRLYEYIGAIITKEKCNLISVGGISDHIHLLVRMSTQYPVSDLIRRVKANSSKFINQIFNPQIKFSWQSGYGAFAVSMSKLVAVQNYIENQEAHHKVNSFEDEFRSFLDKHAIKYDKNFLFQ